MGLHELSDREPSRLRVSKPSIRPGQVSNGGSVPSLLHLQRAAGNRAVVGLLSGGKASPDAKEPGRGDEVRVQRKLNVTTKQLGKLSTATGNVRAAFGHETTFAEIERYLKLYQKATDQEAAVRNLFAIEMLAKEWLDRHRSSDRKSDTKKAGVLQKLVEECDAEIAKLQPDFDAVYERKLVITNLALGHAGGDDPRYAQQAKAKPGRGFQYITASATEDKRTTDDEGQVKINPGGTKIDQFSEMKARPAVAGKGLTDAELAAIRVYSGGDYKTINPTLEGNDAWLAGNVAELAGVKPSETTFARDATKKAVATGKASERQRRQMKVDAMMHARMAVSGLKKLPDVTTDAYRGLTMTLDQLIVEYKAGKRIVYKPFTSTSTKKAMSEGYASIPKPGMVGVLLTLKVNKGKDIKEISVAAKEGEVLLLPGAEFEVTAAPTLVGSLYHVTLTQVDAGGVPASPPGPAVSLNNPAAGPQVAASGTATGTQAAGPVAAQAQQTAPGPQGAGRDLASDLKAKASAEGKRLIADAKLAEPAITGLLESLCRMEKGCRLAGTEHKLKTEQSLARKLEAKATTRVTRDGVDADAAVKLEAAAANDVLRYTMVAPVKSYRQVETRVRDALSKQYKIVNNWDAWKDPNAKTYKGLNMGFRTSSGLIFEFQLHTDSSFAMKQSIHEEYEEARESGTAAERKKALENYMEAKWKGVAVPALPAQKPKK